MHGADAIDMAAAGHAEEHDHHDQAPEHEVSAGLKAVNLGAVVLPFIGLIAAIVLLWGRGFTWVELSLFVGMYLISGLGITVGYHRLFTHRSFDTGPVLKFFFAMAGSMALEGPLLRWVAQHRQHHQHSDHDGDPHSPHLHGKGFKGLLQGMWHSHVGWVFQGTPPDLHRYVPDLMKDRLLRWMSDTFVLWAAVGIILPTILGGLITWSWTGALLGFLWGGLARIFFVHHVTWSINSVCHLWGARPYRSHDHSRNNVVFGVLAMGEGWHNNHHAFPTSARHGLRWWQFDLSYVIIRGLELCGLAWNVRVPSAETMKAKQTAGGDTPAPTT